MKIHLDFADSEAGNNQSMLVSSDAHHLRPLNAGGRICDMLIVNDKVAPGLTCSPALERNANLFTAKEHLLEAIRIAWLNYAGY